MSTGVMVATCGNRMAGDDAFGPLVGQQLRGLSLEHVRVVDLDIKPAALLDHLPGPDVLILVDAARISEDGANVGMEDAVQTGSGIAPGGLLHLDLTRQTLPSLLHDDALSSHGMGLADQLALARQIGVLPAEVHLVAAPVEHVGLGGDQRPQMPQLVADAVALIVQVAQRTKEAVGDA